MREWADELDAVGVRPDRRFTRRTFGYLRGQLSGVERKNGWQLADPAPHRARADWDADRIRYDLVAYARERLAVAEDVLIVDDSGLLEEGDESADIRRRYSGTVGLIENRKVGVFPRSRASRACAAGSGVVPAQALSRRPRPPRRGTRSGGRRVRHPTAVGRADA
ncbi:transposase [Paludisphaera mucosa]|uniref:Transposase n=1 Tax=Paludisphaera mucosa TaxID=3030827 RepID=A0ABT6FLB8_9BACT|nr:transposase [Paludisphaera mucosa]